MWIVCITSVRHVLTVNGYGGRQTKENEKSWCFKGWETLVNNPVIIEYNNIRYVVDTPNVDSIPQKDIYAYLDSTFHYLLGDNIFYDLPNFLYDKVIKFYNDEVCEYVIDSNRKNYNILYFKTHPKRFILVALNIAYYNKKHSSIDALQFIRSDSPLNTYVLIAYPIV